MATDRREFMKLGAAAAASGLLLGGAEGAEAAPTEVPGIPAAFSSRRAPTT